MRESVEKKLIDAYNSLGKRPQMIYVMYGTRGYSIRTMKPSRQARRWTRAGAFTSEIDIDDFTDAVKSAMIELGGNV